MSSRILVASNGSHASEKAAQFAIDLARGSTEAELLFCYVIDVNKLWARAQRGFEDCTFALSHVRSAASAILDQNRALASSCGVSSMGVIREGNPAEEISLLADDSDADLVVIGSRATNKLLRLFSGSVRDELLNTLERPILAVPD
jgi:nucleotide-binding universal stress UspA family protein